MDLSSKMITGCKTKKKGAEVETNELDITSLCLRHTDTV